MKKLIKPLTLFLVGGIIYGLVELLFRQRTHWTMLLVGGLCFLLIGGINNYLPWSLGIIQQCLIGAIIITAVELAVGLIVNVRLGWAVWDYSNMPLNFMGQICPQFTLAWIPLSGAAIVLDDWLRYWLFGEDRPHYSIL